MFEIDTGLIFWTTLTFIILVALLYKLVFPPLQKVLKERRDAIEGGLAGAEKARVEAESLLQKHHQQLAEAEKKTQEMFDEARRMTQEIREDAVKNAQKEAFGIIESSKKDIEMFKRKALKDLKGDISEIIVDVNRQLIKKELSAGDQKRLLEISVKELEKNAKRKLSA